MYCSKWSVYCFLLIQFLWQPQLFQLLFYLALIRKKNVFNFAYSVAFYHHRFDLDSDWNEYSVICQCFHFCDFLLIVFHYLGKNQFFLHYLDCTRECNEKIKRAVTELRFFFIQVWECGNTKKSEKPGLPRMFQCMAIYWLICYRQNVITDIQT